MICLINNAAFCSISVSPIQRKKSEPFEKPNHTHIIFFKWTKSYLLIFWTYIYWRLLKIKHIKTNWSKSDRVLSSTMFKTLSIWELQWIHIALVKHLGRTVFFIVFFIKSIQFSMHHGQTLSKATWFHIICFKFVLSKNRKAFKPSSRGKK